MGLINLEDLKLEKDKSSVKIPFNGTEIEVYKTISVDDRLVFIQNVLRYAFDEGEYIPCRVDIATAVNLIVFYTNIVLSKEELEDISGTADKIMQSGLLKVVLEALDDFGESKYLIDDINKAVEQRNKEKLSTLGVINLLLKKAPIVMNSVLSDVLAFLESEDVKKLIK